MRMTRSRTAVRPYARRAVPALLCAAALACSAAQAAAMPSSRLADSTPAAADQSTVALPGQQFGPQELTLVTGDRVSLTPAAGGRYSVTATAVPRPSGPTPAINATARQDRTGHMTSIYAVPGDAAALVQSGAVDKGLFEVSYLAAHGFAKANLPVVVHYSGHPSASMLAQQAADLPASTFVSADPASSQAEVAVDTAAAGTFWNAVTVAATPDTHGPAGAVHIDQPIRDRKLADGIASISMAGHASTPSARTVPATEPLYTVTETVHGSTDHSRWCGSAQALCLFVPTFSLLGVTGAGTGASYAPTNAVCVDTAPCTTYELDYVVPAGVYSADGQAIFVDALSRWQNLDLVNPEVKVTHATAFELDANTETQVSIDTPLPTEPVGLSYSVYRSLPDGSSTLTMSFVGYGSQTYWSMPTAAATVGSFHMVTRWVLAHPQVSMTEAKPHAATLHPRYPLYYSSPEESRPVVRFPSQLTAQVVNAGGGTSEDFANVDVRGKLALVRVKTFVGCRIQTEQMTNAVKAGAVGVMFDPTDPAQPDSDCGDTLYPNWWTEEGASAPPIPYASLPLAEAHALDSQLEHGKVTVKVAGGGPSTYLYPLNFYQEGRVPASLHYSVPKQQTVLVHANYHSSHSTPALWDFGAWRPNENISAGATYEHFDVPRTLTEYFGPVAPDLVTFQERTLGTATVHGTWDTRYDVFSQGGTSRTFDWDEGPVAPGAASAPTDVFAAQPGHFDGDQFVQYCSACRQGNTFFPYMYLVSGADARVLDGPYTYTDLHLYRGDQEIAADSGALRTYTLPPDSAQYRMTVDGTDSHTEWHFTSGASAENTRPDGTVCVGTLLGSDVPCQAPPLVFLRYDADLSLTNTVAAPGQRQITVSAYHQAPGAPAITRLRLWISVDGGSTWQQEQVSNRGHGDYQSSYTLPTRSHTDGAVSIKVQATDADGNDIVQELDDAFAITGQR